jgi:hypothetical protein
MNREEKFKNHVFKQSLQILDVCFVDFFSFYFNKMFFKLVLVSIFVSHTISGFEHLNGPRRFIRAGF